jgi:hypothetical protein
VLVNVHKSKFWSEKESALPFSCQSWANLRWSLIYLLLHFCGGCNLLLKINPCMYPISYKAV